MRPVRTLRGLAISLALILSTCETTPDPTLTPLDVPRGVGLLAVDLDAVADGSAHADLSLLVDGEAVARVGLQAGSGALEGRAAWPIPAGEHEVGLVLRSDEGAARGRVTVRVGADSVVPLAVERKGPELSLRAGVASPLPDDTGVTVDYRDGEQAWQQRVGARPAARVAALLADPQLAVITPVSRGRSAVDGVGPLVAWQPIRARGTRGTRGTGATAQVSNGGQYATSAPDARATPPVPALIHTYTYCTCGSPVPRRSYTLRTTAGVELRGRTDAFGLLLLRDARLAGVDYGRGQRARKRSYAFRAGTHETRGNILRGLDSTNPNEALTALLDLRLSPLPSARERLLALLDHPDQVWWRNAGIALGHYPDVDDAVAERARLLRRGIAPERQLFLLGALRRASAIPAILPALGHDDAKVRSMAAWALGFIAHGDAAPALVGALSDDDAKVRAAAALALGRAGEAAHVGDLEPLLDDADAEVQQRAAEGVALLQAHGELRRR